MIRAPAEISRELITLSRRGGINFKEKGQAEDAKGKASNKSSGKNAPSGGKKMKASQSAPALAENSSLGATKGSMAGSRRGGGWDRPAPVDLTLLKEILDQAQELNCDLDFCEKPFHRPALWEAAWKNHEAIVKLLASKGASISKADYQGRTPLHEAAFYGHLNMVEFLVERGHPLDCVDVFGHTPLFRAADAGRFEVMRYLVNRGAKTNNLDTDNVTASHVAAFRGSRMLSDFLYYNGAVKNRFHIEKPPSETLLRTKSLPGVMRDASHGAIRSGGALVMNNSSSLRKPR
jgi:ankyrin repeat protein